MNDRQISWMTLARILKAFPLLARKSGTSAKELADELGINNTRDVERSFLPALERIGVLVEDLDMGKPGVAHRYRLINQAVSQVRIGVPQDPIPGLPPVETLDPAEALVLDWMLSGGGILEEASGINTILDSLRSKLASALADPGLAHGKALSPGMARGLDSLFATMVRGGKDYSGEKGEFIIPLAEAIQDCRICTVTYQSPSQTGPKTYDIWPLYMVENSGGLYVLALADKYRNRYIPLAVDRIQKCQVTGRHFEYPVDFDPKAFLDSAFDIHFDEIREYRIAFDPGAAPYIRERRWAAEQTLEDQEDGSTILWMRTRGYPDIKRWVLGHGSAARVLEPADLAADIQEEAGLMHARTNATSLYIKPRDTTL